MDRPGLRLRNRLGSFLRIDPGSSARTVFLLCLGLYLAAFLPLMLRGWLYIDDFGRVLSGGLGWDIVGRPLANVLFRTVSLGWPALDIAPFPQLAAILGLAVSSVLVSRLFDSPSPVLTALAVSAIGLQPYWLENISYRFDSIGMSLSLLLAVLPCCVRLRPVAQFALTAACLLASLSLYQPGFNAFLVLAAFLLIRLGTTRPTPRDEVVRLLVLAAAALAALVVYVPFGRSQIPKHEYGRAIIQTPTPADLPGTILKNQLDVLNVVRADWLHSYFGKLVFVVVLLGLACLVVAAWRGRRVSLGEKLARTVLVIGAIPVLVVAVQALQLVLVSPVWAPRTFVALGVFLAVAGAALAGSAIPLVRLAAWPLLAIQCFGFVTFSYIYTNNATAQLRYEQRVLSDLIRDIEGIDPAGAATHIGIVGSLHHGPILERSISKYPAVAKLVPILVRQNLYWAHIQLRAMGLDFNQTPLTTPELMRIGCATPPALLTRRYSIHVSGKTVIIWFAPKRRPSLPSLAPPPVAGEAQAPVPASAGEATRSWLETSCTVSGG